MGNGPYHYEKAVGLLRQASQKTTSEVIDSLAAEAIPHAMLADVAARIDIANGDTAKWKEVMK